MASPAMAEKIFAVPELLEIVLIKTLSDGYGCDAWPGIKHMFAMQRINKTFQ